MKKIVVFLTDGTVAKFEGESCSINYNETNTAWEISGDSGGLIAPREKVNLIEVSTPSPEKVELNHQGDFN